MRGALLVIAVLTAACGLTGPSDDLSGHWVARSAGRFDLIGLTITQSGDRITGTACATSGGMLLYKGVPIFGEFPDLQFTVTATYTQPCCAVVAGTYFKGRQDSTEDIIGHYGSVDIRFTRADSSLCPS